MIQISIHQKLIHYCRRSKGKGFEQEEETGIPPPPELPVNSHAPWINIPSSLLMDHWSKMVNNADLSDVEFTVGRHTYHAHRAVLCSASEFFRRLFGVEVKVKVESLGECGGWGKKKLQKVTPDGVNLGLVEGVESFSFM